MSQDIQREKVAADLLNAVETVPGDLHSIHVVLTDQVDLTALDARLTAQRATASQRSATVITALREKAAQTQGELLAVLESLPGIRRGSVQAYWIANAILVEADASAVAALSRRSDVGWVGLNRPAVPVAAEKSSAPLPLSPNGREPGLGVIHAPALWAKGYSGYGRRIFIPDTGVDPHHPALGSHLMSCLLLRPKMFWAAGVAASGLFRAEARREGRSPLRARPPAAAEEAGDGDVGGGVNGGTHAYRRLRWLCGLVLAAVGVECIVR